jgi:hypothetical protein
MLSEPFAHCGQLSGKFEPRYSDNDGAHAYPPLFSLTLELGAQGALKPPEFNVCSGLNMSSCTSLRKILHRPVGAPRALADDIVGAGLFVTGRAAGLG